ncbi:hypothetical protein [Mucilaginibacter rubeus]|uniref:Uncharacterized protein n=1 Tax=Mucilaginibacter rubeus TaxID=2027860 RepID=A0A5C1I0M2_9SPHI|nr:hypothetical protein [Mucilaginibacter rubeus]QEM11722.1 hypothetical protein DEO27_017375 [Mucilaginibacter rubeus]
MQRICILIVSFWFLLVLLHNPCAFGQGSAPSKTGYLPDAAEEDWPADTGNNRAFFEGLKHIPIRRHKGFLSTGGSIREVYEYFKNYLWGIGPQDSNGIPPMNSYRYYRYLKDC